MQAQEELEPEVVEQALAVVALAQVEPVQAGAARVQVVGVLAWAEALARARGWVQEREQGSVLAQARVAPPQPESALRARGSVYRAKQWHSGLRALVQQQAWARGLACARA